MQKGYTVSCLTKKQAVNEGQLDQFFVKNAHETIVSEEDWEAVQEEMERRAKFTEKHGIREASTIIGTAFLGKAFCGDCGGHFVRKRWKGIREPFWKCCNAEKKKDKTCRMGLVRESDLRNAFTIAWNDIVDHPEEHMVR